MLHCCISTLLHCYIVALLQCYNVIVFYSLLCTMASLQTAIRQHQQVIKIAQLSHRNVQMIGELVIWCSIFLQWKADTLSVLFRVSNNQQAQTTYSRRDEMKIYSLLIFLLFIVINSNQSRLPPEGKSKCEQKLICFWCWKNSNINSNFNDKQSN